MVLSVCVVVVVVVFAVVVEQNFLKTLNLESSTGVNVTYWEGIIITFSG